MRAQSETIPQDIELCLLLPVLQNGRVGYINRLGQLRISPQFSPVNTNFKVLSAATLRSFHEGLTPVNISGKWGYMDAAGTLLIQEQFDDAGIFLGGLAAVKISGQWGVIDTTGNIIVNPQFEEMGGFSDGAVSVRKNGKWGYITATGDYLVRPQFDALTGSRWTTIINQPAHGHFSEGLAGAKVGQKWGYIDRTGRFMVIPQYEGAHSYFPGLAGVQVGDRWVYLDFNATAKDRLFGIGVVRDPHPRLHALHAECPVHQGSISGLFGLVGPDSGRFGPGQIKPAHCRQSSFRRGYRHFYFCSLMADRALGFEHDALFRANSFQGTSSTASFQVFRFARQWTACQRH